MSKRILGGLAPLLFPFATYAAPSLLTGAYQARPAGARELSLRHDAKIVSDGVHETVSVSSDAGLTLERGRTVVELMVIDDSVADKSTLLQHLKPGVAVIELDRNQDGLAQLAQALASYQQLSAIHVVSHARDGILLLGNQLLDTATVESDPRFFNAIQSALKADGDVLFYGCDLAKSEVGEAWLDVVSRGTQADVAASNDLTGNHTLGGDWTLEIARGDIEATLPFSDKALKDFQGVLAPTAYHMLGFYNANPGSYFQVSSIDSADGKLLLSSPSGKISVFDDGQTAYGMSLAVDGSGNYYGRPFQVAADGSLASTFELNSLLLCNDSGAFGPSAEFTTNLTISGFYANNASAGSVNVSVTTKACVYGANSNDVDIVDVSGTFGAGKDLARFVINYNGTPPNDRYLVLRSLTVDNFKAPDTTAPIFDTTPTVGSLTVAGGTVSANLDEDGTVYYVVVTDGAGAPSVAQVKAGQDSGGGTALVSGDFTTSSTTGSEAFSGLTQGTAYDLYVVAQDDEGTPNVQGSATLVNFTTTASNTNGDLTASGTVSEPVGLSSTIDTSGEAVAVFDFNIVDGSGDGLSLFVSGLDLSVSGSMSASDRVKITWLLNGPGVTDAVGSFNGPTTTLSFSSLGITVAEGGTNTYTLSAYYNDNTGLTDGSAVVFSIDGDTGLVVGGAGTQMGTTTPVTNGLGTTSDIEATALVFSTQPAGSTSGSALTTQPSVAARDAFGNTDTNFTEVITLTEASSGTLSNASQAATSGVAIFTGLTYTASADQQSFTLTANDQDGVGSNLPTVNANAVTSDVVATKLIFSTQPAPLSVNSGVTTALSTVPVVSAMDADNIVDTGYSTGITLAEVNGAGSATLTTTGDTDGSGATVTLTPSSGVATFLSAQITYTASGGSSENFNLQASSGGLSTANSSQMTGVVDSTPPTVSSVSVPANATYLTGQNLDFTVNASESVTVNTAGGTPQLSLTVGATTRQATYLSGSGTNALLFRYVIQAGDNDTDGIAIGTLSANGGTLRDAASNNMTLTLNSVGSTASVLVDATAPTVSSVSVPANATYVTGQNLDFTVNTSESVTVNTGGGTPQLSLTVGATTRQATYLNGSGTSALMFRYTVQAGDSDTDGIAIGTLSANGGTLQDAASNNMTLTLNSVGSTASVLVDATAPTVSSVSVPANATYIAGQNLDFVVNTNKNVTVNTGGGTPQLSLTVGATTRQASYLSGSGSSALLFRYTIQAGDSDTDGIAIGTLSANGGTLRDAASNNMTLTLNSVGSTAGVLVNNAPTGTADNATTDEDNAVAINVLANDSDSDNSLNAASVSITSAPSHGSTRINTGTGVITFTPDANYNGSDSFTYTVDDVLGSTSANTAVNVSINAVNDAPVAVADVVNTATGTAVNISVGANDTDVDTGDSVDTATISLVTLPVNGSAVVSAGQVVYTPVANFSGSDSFTYQIDDQNGATSNVATVKINVSGVNSAPTAVNDSGTTDEDTAVNINLINNDSDADGSVEVSSVAIIEQPVNGSVNVDVSGQATYTPDADYHGSDSFTYVVQDNGGATSNVATVTLTVNSINDAPAANSDTVSIQESTPYKINVLGNDADVDGTIQSGTLQIVSAPSNGSAAISGGTITYTPGGGFSSDSLTYRVQDDVGTWSNIATVTLTSQPVNNAPLANNDSATTTEDSPVIISVLSNDADVDGTLDNTSITIGTAPASGNLVDNNDGTVTYTPSANSYGSDHFTYSVRDNEASSSNSATVAISIRAVNDVPTISGSPVLSVLEGQPYSFTPTLGDEDSTNLSVSATNLPGWLVLDSATGALTGTPQVGDAGSYSNIVLSITDGRDSATLAAFNITVVGDNDTDGIANTVDTDDDNDGMSDSYEQSNGFNPLDASDAAQDRDGDRVTNLQESLDNTDPDDATDYSDITAPIVTAPADLVIDATGLYTRVPLYQLLDLGSTTTTADLQDGLSDLVYDNVDGAGCCNNQVVGMVNSALLLPPGSNTVTYRAVDSKGNQGTATQIVNVRPLVSVNKDQISAEGATVQFRVILNGQSPFYPLTVPYVIDSASTTNAADHDLVNGSVQFTNGQTVASVSIALTADGVSEGDETLIVRLDDRTSNAQDLANGYNPVSPDIYDINSGAQNRHQITVTENNVAPDVSLRLSQNSTNTVLITTTGGAVTVTATVSDPNSGDQHTLDWSATDAALVETDGNNTDANLVFDPGELASGVYKVRVTVTDDNGAQDTASLYFKLVDALPTLGSEDTDGDGTDDATEGTADSDDDGIPDYLDNISAVNVLPEQADETSAFLMECDPDIRCRVGQFALQGEGGGASVLQTELSAQGIETDTEYAYGGGIFDFEMHDLPSLGQSVKVVLPQTSAIPENAVYRKLSNGRWQDFVDDANNQVHSAPGNLGYCPPPGDDSWQPGLTEGDYCVQLTIEDGGPNDADGLANGSIEDPGGVGTQTLSTDDGVPTFPTITSKGKGSGGSMGGGLLLIFGATLFLRRRTRSAPHLALALLASTGASLLPVQNAEAFEWDEAKQQLQEHGYAALAFYRAKGSQGEADFQQGMAASGVNVTLGTYDTTRTAYQFTLGYGYHPHLALELGFLDLGDVRVDMSATGTPDNLRAGLEQHYPVSSEGFTLSNRFLWPVQQQTTLSAEVGLYRWDGKIDISGATVEPDLDGGTDFLLGVAAQYNVTDQFAISAHMKRIFFDDQDVDLFGVEGKIRF